ncbi:rod shape-determining protein MreC [Ilumatobacter nonamiensis]|uniref:rod shape-determining protein MreC n=1 Tax=Ilumatobacter nonamiensis TaxID=467093 RepID=UPI00034D7A8D|nr:rod shape-determining protein MreC [Ilumatobacter nonamiensis]
MPIYTVGRRRVIIALLLSGALLLTLDLRGNAVLDTIRDGFSRAMTPVEQAADVVTSPVRRAWNSYDNYDDLERENLALRDEIDRQRGTQAAAEASIIDYQLLLALNNLPSLSSIDSAKAQVVGGATNNIDQTVEINKGTDDGIDVGMPVVNQAGLIGKITNANARSSTVMLVTDPRYSIPVEILAGTADLELEDPSNTTPSGRTDDENDDLVEQSEAEQAAEEAAAEAAEAEQAAAEETPPGTSPEDIFADEVDLPQAGDPNDPANSTTTTLPEGPPETDADGNPILEPFTTDADGNPIDVPETTTTTTSTLPPDPEQLEKEFGVLQGRGQGRPPQVRFLQDIPSLAELQVGDLIETAGGSESLAPPNIPVGRVINRADRAGVGGPLLEIELNADLDKLNFVRVVLFQPLTEVDEPEVAE